MRHTMVEKTKLVGQLEVTHFPLLGFGGGVGWGLELEMMSMLLRRGRALVPSLFMYLQSPAGASCFGGTSLIASKDGSHGEELPV